TRCSPRRSRWSPCWSSAWRRCRPSAARSRSASGSSGWCSPARSVKRSCCSVSSRSSPRAAGALASRGLRASPRRSSSRSWRYRRTTRCAPTTSRSCAEGRPRFSSAPSSEELARAVSRELLPNEPYRSRGIDLETFFSSGSSRMNDDFVVLADRTWGWDDDYAHLARAAREAVRTHPGAYARGVSRDVWKLLLWPVYAPVEDEAEQSAPITRSARVEASTTSPSPTGDDLIPSSREAPYISTPDGRIREVWTSPEDHGFVFRDAADRT